MPPVSRTWVEDRSLDILVESWSSSAQTIQVRGISDTEQIYHDHTTNSDRSLASSTIQLNAVPKFLTAKAAGTGLKRGTTYVKVSLRAEGVIIATLMRGYITDVSSIFYPYGHAEASNSDNGLVRVITGTDPAAGVEISETVPTGARWRLMGLSVSFVTDATVSNRAPSILIDNGTTTFISVDCPQNIAASQTRILVITPGIARATVVGRADTWGLPQSIMLEAGFRIRTLTSNLQAGDNWGAPNFAVEEWISP